MHTDLLLRRLAVVRAADLLPLLGAEGAIVLHAESPELTSRAVRLDLVLHLRSTQGDEYLHLVEWQGYDNADLLWRTMRYLAELHAQRPRLPIRCTIIYLSRDADVGNAIGVATEEAGGWSFHIQPVRLWELDAQQIAANAAPGLAVLSPIMRGADADMVLRVAQRVASETTADEQAELVTILSVFAEHLVDPEVLVALVGKERLMASGIIGVLVEEEIAETVALSLRGVIADYLRVRFPTAADTTFQALDSIDDGDALRTLFQRLLHVTTEDEAVATIVATAHA